MISTGVVRGADATQLCRPGEPGTPVEIARASGATWSPRRLHQGTIVGGILFGAGWALSGACPGIALVQIGEGQLGAIATLGGILVGNWIYAAAHERWLRWPTEGCADQ